MSSSSKTLSTLVPVKITEMVGSKVVSTVELLSQTCLGQSILKLFDCTLWIIEKTAQWSLTEKECPREENGKLCSTEDTVRPLPWIFFIPTLIILRITRFTINLGAVLLGRPKMSPQDLVTRMQVARNCISSIQSQGMQVIEERDTGTESPKQDGTSNVVSSANEVQGKESQLNETAGDKTDDEPIVETLIETIDRFVEEESEDDEDYKPEEHEESSSDSDEDIDIPVEEVENLLAEQKEVLENANKNVPVENRAASPSRVTSKGHYPQEKYKIDGEDTFYSPISSTSVSPERSVTPIKLSTASKENTNQPRKSKAGGNDANGDVHFEKRSVELEKLLCSDDGNNTNIGNGRNEERKHEKNSKNHHKNKRSNCASRKKK